MSPTGKTGKKRGKISSSFRKGKLTPLNSGKKFKAMKKSLKMARKRSIGNTSFSPDSMSTPRGPKGSGSARKKRKLNPKKENEFTKILDKEGSSTPVQMPTLPSLVSLLKKPPVLPPNLFLKEDIKDRFRNNHIIEQAVAVDMCGNLDTKDEIIVIEDDDEIEEGELVDSSQVVELGEEMLDLVSNEASKQPIPDTPRTVLNKLATKNVQSIPDTPRTVIHQLTNKDIADKEFEAATCNSVIDQPINELTLEPVSDATLDATGDETIVLDSTVDDEEEITIIESVAPPVSGTTQTLQEVTRRYQQPREALDFIPLSSNRGNPSNRRQFTYSQAVRKNRGGRGRGNDISKQSGTVFNEAQLIPQINFASANSGGGRVFRFTAGNSGTRRPAPPGNKQTVATGSTMYVGGDGGQGKGSGLRPIVIDGSNVAMGHGRHSKFSAKGIELVVNYFKERGHEKIIAFVPEFRKGHDPILLERLENDGYLAFTPSRTLPDKTKIISYDDTYMLDYAAKHGGVVVTRDNYRDLANEKPEWKEVVEKRLLMPTFVGDDVMWPHDPLGRNGPTLDQFLKF